jgi:hypothetical protein
MNYLLHAVSIISRGVAILLPPLVTLTILANADRLDEFGDDFVALQATSAIVGLTAGLLLRWWGAGCLVPLLIIAVATAVFIADRIQGGPCGGYHCDPTPLGGFLSYFVGPFVIPATFAALLGAWVGKVIERKVMPTSENE